MAIPSLPSLGGLLPNNNFFDSPDKKRLPENQTNLPTDTSLGSLQSLEVRAEKVEIQAFQDGQFLAGSQETFSLEASFQSDNFLVNIELEVQRTVLFFGSSQVAPELRDSLLESTPEETRGTLENFLAQEEFASQTPENVSERIFDFAQNSFQSFLNQERQEDEDEKEEREEPLERRQRFLDQIQPAINNGIDEALTILDPFLNDDILGLVERTRDLIQSRLEGFFGEQLTADENSENQIDESEEKPTIDIQA